MMTASLFIDAWFMRYLDILQAIEFKKFVFFFSFFGNLNLTNRRLRSQGFITIICKNIEIIYNLTCCDYLVLSFFDRSFPCINWKYS